MKSLLKLLASKNILVWFVCEKGTITGIQNGVYITLSKGILCRSVHFSLFRVVSYSDDVKVLYSYVDIDSEVFKTFLYQIFPQNHRLRFFDNENKILKLSDDNMEKFKKHAETRELLEHEINAPNVAPEKRKLLEYSCLLKKMDTILDIAIDFSNTHSAGKLPEAESSLFVFFREFMLLIEQYCHQEHYMEFYANQMNCSVRHLTEGIKKFSGKTPSQWLNNVLISKVKVDLLQNNKSVTQLMLDYNFSDSSVLYSFFKRETGYSPQQYRTKHMAGEIA